MKFELNPDSKLLSQLESTDWFQNVGTPIDKAHFHVVKTWDEGFKLIEHEVRRWCSIEARNALYNRLSANHRNRFYTWNDIAGGLARPVSEIVIRATAVPGIPEFPKSAREWLHGMLIGAFMEEEYADCIQVNLFRKLKDLLCAGRFPRG